jgi:hypothetical protein
MDIIQSSCPLFRNGLSETEFYLRLQVEPTQLGPIQVTRANLRTGVRSIQSPKRRVLNKE